MFFLRFVSLLIFTVNAYALNDCRQYQNNHPELEWKILTELKVSAVVTDLDAILCAGFKGKTPILVSYKDSSGSDELFPVKGLNSKTYCYFN